MVITKPKEFKYSCKLLLISILATQLIFLPSPSFGQTHLRPLAAKVSRPIIPEAQPLKMVQLFGDGTSPAKIVRGKAAIAAPYSAEELIHSVQLNELHAENSRLTRLVAAIIKDFRIRYPDNADFCRALMQRLVAYRKQVRNYFHERCKLAEKEKRVLIRDGISMLEFLISNDLGRERGLGNEEEAKLLSIISDKVKEYVTHERPLVRLKDPPNPTTQERELIRQRAEEDWQRFLEVQGQMNELYDGLIEQLTSRVARLRNNIKGFEAKTEAFRKSLETISDPDETAVIEKRISAAEAAIERMRADIKKSNTAIGLYQMYVGIIDSLPHDLQGAERSVAERLAKENRSIADILYDSYKALEKNRAGVDRSAPGGPDEPSGEEIYAKMTEPLRILEDIIGHILEIDPFYFKGPVGEENLILFTDTEIGMASLFKLASRYRINGIASLEGTTVSHWVIIAAQMGIPIVILKGLKQRHGHVEQYVSPGNDVILQTQQKEGESRAVINPDESMDVEYQITKRETELYHQLCLSQILSGATRQEGIPVDMFGNASSAEDVIDIFREGGNSIGLLRTEISLEKHATILKSYIQDSRAVGDGIYRSAHRGVLLAEARNDILSYFELFKDRQGQTVVTIRTFDIKKDKNKDILDEMPKDQQKEGFEFYRTEIGKNILILQIVAILQAAYKANQEGCNVKPVVIFPMVRNEDDLIWISHKIFPNALMETLSWVAAETHHKQTAPELPQDAISLAKLQEALAEAIKGAEGSSPARPILDLAILEDIAKQSRVIAGAEEGHVIDRATLNNFIAAAKGIVYGPMVETADIIDNIDVVVADPDAETFSVGTNDLTEEIVAGEFEAFGSSTKVNRDDEYFERFFFELRPSVLRAIIRVAEAIARWNREHPDNIKRLGFCGEIASRKKFLLFALWLKDKYDIPTYLSMPAESIPVMEYFRSFVKKEDLSIFDGEIGFKVEPMAVAVVDRVDERIRQTEEYKREVASELEPMRVLMKGLLDAKAQPTDPPNPAVLVAISEAA